MFKQKILDIIPSCCDIGFLSIFDSTLMEQSIIKDFFPKTNTIIILAHHVTNSLEWAWYPHETERIKSTCGADLHAKNVIEQVEYCLKEEGCTNYVVPYPGKCGIRMKDLANKTSLGHIGDNFLFLHKQWGPWVHLRLLLTDAKIESDISFNTSVCCHCGKCIAACPAKALKIDSFDGDCCGEYQMSQNIGIKDYFWKCEVCVRVCPIGKPPLPLKIMSDDNKYSN